MRKLSKRDVEALLSEYDNNPVGALHQALRVLLTDCPSDWNAAIGLLDIDDANKQSLRDGNIAALDSLAKHFVETRGL
jgi:hypothetical protein